MKVGYQEDMFIFSGSFNEYLYPAYFFGYSDVIHTEQNRKYSGLQIGYMCTKSVRMNGANVLNNAYACTTIVPKSEERFAKTESISTIPKQMLHV